MKKTKGIHGKNSRKYRKHPIGQRLIAGLLCICLLLVSLPMKNYGGLAWAAERKEIVVFPAISQEVRLQTVSIGTEIEELELPETLTAVCRPPQEDTFHGLRRGILEVKAAEPAQVPELEKAEEEASPESEELENLEESGGQEPSGESEGPEPPMDESGEELPADGTEAAPGEPDPEAPGDTSGTEPPGENTESSPEEPEPLPPEEEPVQEENQTETITIEGITWKSQPEYDKEKKGIYTFTPVLPLGYTLAEGVELPEISVAVMPGGKQEDMVLYAVFQKELTASFYSGNAGQKETKTIALEEGEENGTVKVPELQELKGYVPVGWDAVSEGYAGELKAGDEITLAKDKAYYGVYQKDITLTYDLGGAEQGPEADRRPAYAKVLEEDVTYAPAEFTIADAPEHPNWDFQGWNTSPDGSGDMYQPGSAYQAQEDTVLYAMFQKTLKADFYSGNNRSRETRSVDVKAGEEGGRITTPELKELAGYTPVGWDEVRLSFAGERKAGEETVLSEDTVYYGIYCRDITLTYDARGAGQGPGQEVMQAFASVQEDDILYAPAEFTIAPGPVRPGSAFAGWNTEPDGSGDMYQEGDMFQTGENTVLYAMFQKTLSATFYSGSEGRADVRSVSITGEAVTGNVQAPELQDLEGFRKAGWSGGSSDYEVQAAVGNEITLERDKEYCGIYEKDVILSYDGGGDGETGVCRANVHNGGISYAPAEFNLLPAPEREGYSFLGWNTEPDGSGDMYAAGSVQKFEEDMVLYAFWEPQVLPYRVEHYLQELEGDSYVREETEEFSDVIDTAVEAQPKEYPGFAENMSHRLRRASGTVKADGSLILRFFYDRDTYYVDFDLNGGEGMEPDPQSVRYGGLLQAVEAPKRRGYSFTGWRLDQKGSAGSLWDFTRPVEDNTASRNVVLYAGWEDDIPPELGEAEYGKGHKDLFHWIIKKDSLKITVPITEEGSGVHRAEYRLIPDKEGNVKFGSLGVQAYGTIGLPIGTARGRTGRIIKKKAAVRTRKGRTQAEFTIDADFKGTIVMTSSDRAGNLSAEKALSADGKGVIVEDNAPKIAFTEKEEEQRVGTAVVRVEVKDSAGEEISGGIAQITYQVDSQKENSVEEKRFQKGIVENYHFTVELSGAGSHALTIKAKDNAGNKSSRRITVEIPGKGTEPLGTEPKTGEGSHVELYATASMIAGFSYLLLYFKEHGMTKEKKEELVLRLVNWAKEGGRIKRMLALGLIFLVLAYYHSMGRSTSADWREVYEK